MKIILSPAKKMKTDTDSIGILSCPVFMEKTEEILSWLKGRTEEELQKMWKCNDNIAAQNIERINSMNLYKQLTPAVLAYEGIAYQYMAPVVFIMPYCSLCLKEQGAVKEALPQNCMAAQL